MSRTATPLDVIAGRARWCLVEGDSFRGLCDMPCSAVDAVVTDPPYSSGGAFRGDRTKSTDSKYTGTEYQGARPDFAGDTRDMRAFLTWFALWGHEAKRVSKANGRLLAFTDWRQLGVTMDAVQVAGWILRGVVPWNKGEGTRPTPGGFRGQCEYVVWSSSGPLPQAEEGVIVLPGFFTATVTKDDKHHQTGKPTSLMRELVRVAPRDGVVLDPFAGSGTTGVAALAEGRRTICFEVVPEYAEIARCRMEAAESGASYVPGGSTQGNLLLSGRP